MKITILGSGGVVPIPRPGCSCRICAEAKEKGIPYKRTGPAIFIEGIDLLFDCPEEIREQLIRENISSVKNVILTHWHPDHTLGIRILEQLNWDFVNAKPFKDPINVYMSGEQYNLFKKFSCGGFLDFYAKKGFIKILFFKPNDILEFGKIKVQPVLIEHTKGFYFVISEKNKKVVYAPCEYHHLKVDKDTRNIDLLIAHNLFWENKAVSSREKPPADEDSFEQMLAHSKEMKAKKIVILHIEETFKLNHDELNAAFKKYYPKYNLVASYDGMKINL